MRTYEALYIVHPEVKDDEIQTIAKNVETLVTDNGGAIVRSEIQGRRKLAYEVKRCTEGCYVLLRFQSGPEFITRLETYFRLTENIIRTMTRTTTMIATADGAPHVIVTMTMTTMTTMTGTADAGDGPRARLHPMTINASTLGGMDGCRICGCRT